MQTTLKATESLSFSYLGNKIRVYGVVGDDVIKEVWKDVSPMIETSLPYSAGKYLLEDIKKAILDLDMQLWVGRDHSGFCAAAVTQIVHFPRSVRVTMLFFGGKRVPELLESDIIFQWAKSLGCSHIELFGRPGWERFLNRKGYPFEKIHTVLQMKI